MTSQPVHSATRGARSLFVQESHTGEKILKPVNQTLPNRLTNVTSQRHFLCLSGTSRAVRPAQQKRPYALRLWATCLPPPYPVSRDITREAGKTAPRLSSECDPTKGLLPTLNERGDAVIQRRLFFWGRGFRRYLPMTRRKRSCKDGLDLNSPVNCVVIVDTSG